MPLDPKGLTIDTSTKGKRTKVRIYHEPSGCMVEGEGANQINVVEKLLKELEKQVFHLD